MFNNIYIVKEFIESYGKDSAENIYSTLNKNKLVDKFMEIYDDLYHLFFFSLQHKLLDLIEFLYIKKNIYYEDKKRLLVYAMEHKMANFVEYLCLKEKILYDKNKLFEFALRHGMYQLVAYLYIKKNVVFDIGMLDEYIIKIEGKEGVGVTVSNGSSNKTSFVAQKWDKYYEDRQMCIKLLTVDLRPYSSYSSKNSRFLYRFNGYNRLKSNIHLAKQFDFIYD